MPLTYRSDPLPDVARAMLPESWPLFAGLGPLVALPTVPRLARTFGSLVLSGWGLGRLTDDYELVVSELTANVVQAVTGPDGQPHHDLSRHLPGLGLRLLSDHERLRVEVWDDLPLTLGVPALRQADAEDESGRGLELVAALSHDWGWEPLPGDNTKRVWATLPR